MTPKQVEYAAPGLYGPDAGAGRVEEAIMDEATARINADNCIRQLWCAFFSLSDFGETALTEEDFVLWDRVTHHRAVQDRFDAVAKAELRKP